MTIRVSHLPPATISQLVARVRDRGGCRRRASGPTTGPSGAARGASACGTRRASSRRFPPADLTGRRGARPSTPATRDRPSPAAACSSPTARRVKGQPAPSSASVALDEQTGRVLWTQEWQTDYSGLQLVYAIGPRATPTVDGDRVLRRSAPWATCSRSTSTTGRILWQKDYVEGFQRARFRPGASRRAAGRRRSADLPGRRRAGRQGRRARQAHGRGDLAVAVVGHRARLQPADHHRGRRRAAADHLPRRGLQLARSGDRQGALGDRTPRPDGHRRRDAGAERPVPVLHVAVRRRPHAEARRHRSRRRRCCGAARASRIRDDPRHAGHAELGDQHAGHRRRLRVRHRQRRPAALPRSRDGQAAVEDRRAPQGARHVRHGVLRAATAIATSSTTTGASW